MARGPNEQTTPEQRDDAPLPPAVPQPGMFVTERVQLVRPLGSGGMADVWVADHLTLGVDVAVKFIRGASTRLSRERLSQEARLAAKIVHPHGVRIFDHGLTSDGTPFMVMERVEGEPLSRRLKRAGPLGIDGVRRLVSQVAQVLHEAHGLGILHRDIKPHNIMLTAGTEGLFVKVLDFGLAKPMDQEEDLSLTAADAMVGTPIYMAPEQLIDQLPADVRSDLWGLSVVAYEALTGQRPFEGPGRAALGAAILLRKYEPVTGLLTDAPPALDQWFERALAVEPQRRFSSALELSRSFEEAITGSVGSVASIGHAGGRFTVSGKLYGRTKELDALSEAYARAAAGEPQIAMVAGYAGIGKTALVGALRERVADRGAIFVSGKFDQFDRGTPYLALLQACRELIHYVSTLDAPAMAAWHARLSQHLSGVGRILTEVVPELAELMDPQPPLGDLPPAQRRAQFQYAVARFVAAASSANHPLVLFLDDLQWADLASLELLSALTGSLELRHCLVVGAYRDHEVGRGHPLVETMTSLKKSNALHHLDLGPLDEDAVMELVTDTFGAIVGRVRLAVACHEKTRGNPFFLRRFIETLYEEGLLVYDDDSQTWSWDPARLQARPMTDNVVDFVASEMRRMPRDSQRALAIAACIGDHFDLGILAHAMEVDRSRALAGLREGLIAELILPSATGEWDRGTVALSLGPRRIVFRFAHDRIRQAARSLSTDEEAAAIHQRIGTFMLDSLSPAEREQRLFELVEHLNRGVGERAIDRDKLRALNLSAARRAIRSAAFDPAHGYFRAAQTHLGESAWEDEYDQALAIHVEGARAAYLNGDYETMNRLVDVAVSRATSSLDRVEAREVRLQALVSQQRLLEALDLARDVLAELGVDIPSVPSDADVQTAVGATIERLKTVSKDQVVALPAATDPTAFAAMRVQLLSLSSAYLAAPRLVPMLTSRMVQATLEHGVFSASPYGLAVFGIVLNASGEIDLSYATGQIALALLHRVDDCALHPKTEHVVHTHINPFVDHVGESLSAARRIFASAMDVGDPEFAGWALHIRVCHGLYASVELEELAQIAERNVEVLRFHRQRPPLACTLPYVQAVANLRGEVDDPTRLVGPEYDEVEVMRSLVQGNVRGAAFILTVMGTFVRYLFRDVADAVRFAAAGAEFEDGALSTYHQVVFAQYRALSLLGQVGVGAADARERVTPMIERLRIWQGSSPPNLDHRLALVEAELARVEARSGDAMARYDEAIDHAREHRFRAEEALANELAARFHLERKALTPARAYAREAIELYRQWGATAKADHLEAELAPTLKRRR